MSDSRLESSASTMSSVFSNSSFLQLPVLASIRPGRELTKVIDKYNQNVYLLHDMYEDLEKHMESIKEILKPQKDETEEENLLDHVDTASLKEKIQMLDSRNASALLQNPSNTKCGHKPCIAVVGQTKSGKSTFLNTLLQEYIVPQSYQRCTARITHLFHSKKNFVQLRDREGIIVPNSYQELPSAALPVDLADLNEEYRKDDVQSSLIVEAGINSKFLARGVDVIDSPGLSENACLDDLVRRMVTSVTPFIIYVIDGRRSLTESDITDIRTIKDNCEDLQIVYFVTKLDATRKNADERKEADKRLSVAFKKLQSNGFLSTEEKMETCTVFHGASLWRVDDYRKKDLKDSENVHVKNFERMEQCILEMVGGYLDYSINTVAASFLNFTESVLEKIIKRAGDIYYDSQNKLNIIENVRKEEKQIYEKVMNRLNTSSSELKNKVLSILENQDRLLEPLRDHTYPDRLDVPEEGQLSQSHATYALCQREIGKVVCQALDTEIRHFIYSDMLTIFAEAENYLITQIRQMSETSVAKTSFRDMLERKWKEIYGVDNGNNPRTQSRSLFSSISRALKSFRDTIYAIFGGRMAITTVNVKDLSWKREHAIHFLRKMNREEFAEKVCQALSVDMEQKHKKFEEALEKEAQCVNSKIQITHENRKKLVEMSPDFAVLYMKSMAIRGCYLFEDLKVEKKIGEGAQGQVIQVSNHGIQMAMKTSSIAKDSLGDIAMEVYFSSTFGHPHLLPLLGVLMQNTDEEEFKQICLIMPMMKSDASQLLKRSKPPLLKRLTLALQVCDAVVYLHTEAQVMHRDLKLANVLIGQNDEAVVADYGFCKKEALAMGSFVGTPVHIAPEIVRGRGQYDKSVDVYSFGILIWYFAEGTGRHPKYTRKCSSVATVLTAADEGARPERLDSMSNELWKLMNECWEFEPRKRPTIQDVHRRLSDIVTAMS